MNTKPLFDKRFQRDTGDFVSVVLAKLAKKQIDASTISRHQSALSRIEDYPWNRKIILT